MPEIIDAAARGDLVLLLATAVVVLGGIIGFLFKLVVDEMRGRRDRAERLTDEANKTNDKMADAYTDLAAGVKELAATTRAALDELRRK